MMKPEPSNDGSRQDRASARAIDRKLVGAGPGNRFVAAIARSKLLVAWPLPIRHAEQAKQRDMRWRTTEADASDPSPLPRDLGKRRLRTARLHHAPMGSIRSCSLPIGCSAKALTYRIGSAQRRVKLRHEHRDAPLDLITCRSDLHDRPTLRVRDFQSISACQGCGASIAAAHRHNHVGLLASSIVSARGTLGQVDATLAHDLDDLWMDALAGGRPRRECGVPPFGVALEQRFAHLRAPGVVQAHEQNGRHQLPIAGCPTARRGGAPPARPPRRASRRGRAREWQGSRRRRRRARQDEGRHRGGRDASERVGGDAPDADRWVGEAAELVKK